MNYEKIRSNLKENGYLDERNLMCHSNSKVQDISYYFFFSKVETITQKDLPKFMILSLNGNILHISKAKLFGGFKEYFGSIDISKLTYVGKNDVVSMDSYEFDFIDGDKKSKFYINAGYFDDNPYYAKQLVDAIIEYNKQ